MTDKCIEGDSGPTEQGWHKIESYLRCPKEYQYGVVRGITVPRHEQPDYLSVGSLVHAGRAKWFALGCPPPKDDNAMAEVAAAMTAEAYKQKLPITLDAQRQATALVGAYINHWSMRAQPQAVAVEYKIGPAPLLNGYSETRTARLDDLSRYPEAGSQLCIGECKTTSTSVNDTINQYRLNGQLVVQLALYKMDPNGEAKFGPVAGVMLDIIKKGYGKDRPAFARELISLPTHVVDRFAKQISEATTQATSTRWNHTVARNISACTRIIGRARVACQFRDLCIRGRNAASQFVFADGTPIVQFTPDDKNNKTSMPWE